MRRRVQIEPRRVVFVGVEGKSERAFAKFLERLCEEAGLHLHPIVKPGNGGDSVEVIQEARLRLERHAGKRDIEGSIVLPDRDRIVQDIQAGRNAPALASKWRLEIIYQEPNLEGVLLRLHSGHEQRKVAAGDAMKVLQEVWPKYRKPLGADLLRRRFDLSSLWRAARFDSELTRLLSILGLLPS